MRRYVKKLVTESRKMQHDTSLWVNYFEKHLAIGLTRYVLSLRELILSIIQSTPPHGRVLEVGVGTGLCSIALAEAGYDVVGTDVDLAVLRYVRENQKRLNKSFPLIRADLFHLPFKKKAFDVIFSQGLMEHFDQQAILIGLREKSICGKIIIFEVPSSLSLRSDIYGDERFFSYYQWKRLIKKSGLKVLSSWGRESRGGLYTFLWLFIPPLLWKFLSPILSTDVGFICAEPDSKR